MDLIIAVQNEISRIQAMLTETKLLLPDSNASFVVYDLLLKQAQVAVATQDTVMLIKLLPELKAA